MKNVLQQGPRDVLNARLRASVEFVDDSDVVGKSVLDIGCGFGWFEADALARGVAEVTAIELTNADLAAARGGISDPRARFLTAGALDLPCATSSVDTVVCWEVIEHIPKSTEPQMFDEIARVLKPGGTLYLSTPGNHPAARLLDPAWWLAGHRHYSVSQLRGLAEAAGFDVVDVHARGRAWTILGLINMYVSKWILRRPPVFGRFFETREAAEFARSDGFANVFLKARPGSKTAGTAS